MDSKNHDAKQMPIGLLMSLAQHDKAMENFSRLSDSQRENLLRFTTGSPSGDEAKGRIDTAIEMINM